MRRRMAATASHTKAKQNKQTRIFMFSGTALSGQAHGRTRHKTKLAVPPSIHLSGWWQMALFSSFVLSSLDPLLTLPSPAPSPCVASISQLAELRPCFLVK